jgi:hypothetical protein
MKKIVVLAAMIFSLATIQSVATAGLIFSENVGSGTGTLSYAANVWQNPTLSFSGTGDTRSTTASAGYLGASGGRNVFLTNNGTASFEISGINTVGYIPGSFDLSFGAIKSTTASNMSELRLSFSSDGVTYTNLSIPTQPTGTGTAIWRSISFTGLNLPTVSNLRLRWVNTGTSTQFRLDDFSLSATAVPEPSALLLVGSVVGFGLIRRRRS